MNPATAPSATPVLHETVARLGTQRKAPRYFVNTRYLARAGFAHQMWLRLSASEGTLVIEPSPTPTGKRVQQKGGLPLIDLNEKRLREIFGDVETVHVRVFPERIVLSVHPLEKRKRERPRDGSLGGLYAGAGFLDDALAQVGYTPKWAVEIDHRAADVYGENHPEALLYAMSVYEVLDLDLEPVEMLAIGQPCPPWSRVRTTTDNSGTKVDRALPPTAHPLGHLVAATMLLIHKLNPRTIILENVPAFASSETGFLLKGYLEEMGYHVDLEVLDAWEHGALTQRKRAILVAQTPEDDGRVVSPWPEPEACTTRVEEIQDPQVPESLWWDRSTHPNRFERVEEARRKGRGFVFQEVRPEDTRVGTFTAEYGNAKVDVPLVVHPEKPETYRYFTLAEGKRIMGVREDYVLPEGQTYPWALLGQGVEGNLFRKIGMRLKNGPPPKPLPALREGDAQIALFGDLPLFQDLN